MLINPGDIERGLELVAGDDARRTSDMETFSQSIRYRCLKNKTSK